MIDLFFYGLFMDRALLVKRGLDPKLIGPARLDDYALRIGQRATLVPRAGAASFGLLMQLQSGEVDELYSEPSVRDYRPERLDVTLLRRGVDGESVEATCYSLPAGSIGSEVNRKYVASLANLAASLDLPADYVREIRSLDTR